MSVVISVVVVAATADGNAVDQICARLKRASQELLIEVCPGLIQLCGRPVVINQRKKCPRLVYSSSDA